MDNEKFMKFILIDKNAAPLKSRQIIRKRIKKGKSYILTDVSSQNEFADFIKGQKVIVSEEYNDAVMVVCFNEALYDALKPYEVQD